MKETLPRDSVSRDHFFSQIEGMRFHRAKKEGQLDGFSKALVDLISSRPGKTWEYEEIEKIVKDDLRQPTNDKEVRRWERVIFGILPTHLYNLSRSGLIISINSEGKRWRGNRS